MPPTSRPASGSPSRRSPPPPTPVNRSAMSKRDRDREISRRALIRWSLAAGAALGVSRAGVLDVLSRAAGRGIADAAAATTTRRSVHLRGVEGGLAWFQL